ncbi:MAG: sugar phosphate nucleotidyltransferase [Patescibacteria group bacterium]|nr:sugar phosphate nucleotidyltransferase [Patescibacteria group bacterium]
MQKVTTAVIAVAGWGSRFLPASKAVPKELFPIVDKPVIEYIVEDCLRSGITEIVFVNSAHKTALEKHFSPNSELNTALEKKGKEELLQAVGRFEGKIDFKYVYQEEALGTAHAILQAKDYIQDKPFVILYGDDFIIGKKPMVRQLLDVYEEKQKSVIGLVEFPESELHKYGIAALDDQNRFQHFVEKPAPGTAPSKYGWIGVSVATPALVPLLETLELSPRGEYEITDAWTQLAAQEDVYTQPFE